MAALRFEEIRELLDMPAGGGMTVSCYADTSAAEGFKSHWRGQFKESASRIREAFAEDVQARQEFEQNLEVIRQIFESPECRTAQGVAAFSSTRRGFKRSFRLDIPVVNRLVVHDLPYLVPLLGLYTQQAEYLAVQVDSQRGRIYRATLAGAALLHELEEEVPKRQHSSGERWGKEQSTIARRREDRILHLHKDLADLVDKTWSSGRLQGIVLLGQHETVEHFRSRLPRRLAAHIVHQAPQSWNGEPTDILTTIRQSLAHVRAAERQSALAELDRRCRDGYGIAIGPHEVVEAIQRGKIAGASLIMGPDPGEVIGRCSACRWLWTDVPASCARCQAPCREANLWEEILRLAVVHQLRVHCIPRDDHPERFDGLAALLTVSERAAPARQPVQGVG